MQLWINNYLDFGLRDIRMMAVFRRHEGSSFRYHSECSYATALYIMVAEAIG